jgi:hypothetical protein
VIQTRICKKCNTEQPICNFHIDNYEKFGHKKVCKTCSKEYYIKNKERILASQKHYRELNKNMIGLKYEAKKQRKSIYNKVYREKNLDELAKYQHDYRIKKTHRIWARNTFRSHKKSGYIMDISIDDIEIIAIQSKQCNICDIELNWGHKNGALEPNSPTLDRINNEKTINKNNIEILCHRCNTAKGKGTREEYIMRCVYIAKKFGKEFKQDRIE